VKNSRLLEELCWNNVTAKALTEDMEPHWTTIAVFHLNLKNHNDPNSKMQ
jgi:hypothetical protein